MKNKEFNLSEKRIVRHGDIFYYEEEVKEFIKIIKNNIWDIMGKDMEKREIILMMIESKAGEFLI